MKPTDWAKIRHFKDDEAWGVASNMDYPFMLKLDAFRDELGAIMIITAGYDTKGHVQNSQHYKSPCKAADFYFKDNVVSPLEAFFVAERMGFRGIGLYPNGGNFFMHLDMRDHNGWVPARWIRDDAGNYVALTGKTFRKYLLKMEAAFSA